MIPAQPPFPSAQPDTVMAAQMILKTAKKELRVAMKSRLSSISHAALESQSKILFQSLTQLKAYKDAQNISVYLSMPSGEIQTDFIVRHALLAGKQVFVPFLHANEAGLKGEKQDDTAPKRIMDMVGLKNLKDYEALERDSWGIPTIRDGALGRRRILGGNVQGRTDGKGDELHLMLLPGVAFETQLDGSGKGQVRRLGHGRGFYDFFLYSYYKSHGQAASEPGQKLQTYGLALEEQFLRDDGEHKVPVGVHDHLLDGLIVGDGQIVDSLTISK